MMILIRILGPLFLKDRVSISKSCKNGRAISFLAFPGDAFIRSPGFATPLKMTFNGHLCRLLEAHYRIDETLYFPGFRAGSRRFSYHFSRDDVPLFIYFQPPLFIFFFAISHHLLKPWICIILLICLATFTHHGSEKKKPGKNKFDDKIIFRYLLLLIQQRGI